MKFFLALSTLALVLPAFGAPAFTKLAVKKSPTGAKADSYIVVLKEGTDKQAHLSALNSVASFAPSSSKITYDKEYSKVLNGYAAVLKGAALDHVLADPTVAYVEEDGLIQINFAPVESELTEADIAARDAHQELVRSIQARASGGAGVTVYGIDTGIRTTHTTFGGRASWGATFGGYANADGNGHGTHTASTAVGATYGVATSANIVAVKVLSDSGSGTYADVIAGINWAVAAGAGKASVATMSLGGSASDSVDAAVSSGISQGVHFTIAAGNSNVDAASTSPARVAAANTIGAVDSTNTKASFSNYGSIVDVWAPGVNILGAWSTSDTATNTISGTSMATPFVAGILAVAIGEYGNKSPADLSTDLKSHAQAIVKGAPSGTTTLRAFTW